MKSMAKDKVVYPEYQHVPRLVLLLFCAYVIIWYLQVGTRISALGAIRIELLVACILIPLAFVTHSKSEIRVDPSLLRLIIGYFVLLFLMTIFSYDFQTSWNIFFNRVLKFAFMAFFIVCFVKSPTGLKFFLAAFMLACMKMGQEGVVGQLTGGLVWQNQGVMRLHGATMMYRHPNSFAGMALGTLPFVMYLFPIVNKWLKALLVIQLVFAFNIILFTGSRTGYIGLLGVILVVFFRSQSKIKILLAILVGLFCVLQFAPEQYVNRFRSIYVSSDHGEYNESLHGGDSSKEKRMQILKDAVSVFIQYPFGVGVGAFPVVREDMFGRSQDTHNLYLEVATNLGVQGVALTLCLFVTALKMNLKYCFLFEKQLHVLESSFMCKGGGDGGVRNCCSDLRLLIAVSKSVFLFVTLRIFLGVFGMDLYEIYWWFACGLIIAVGNIGSIVISRGEFLLVERSAAHVTISKQAN